MVMNLIEIISFVILSLGVILSLIIIEVSIKVACTLVLKVFNLGYSGHFVRTLINPMGS